MYKSDIRDHDTAEKFRHIQTIKRGEAKKRPERVDTATPCSCALCGNPRRKLDEVTLHEMKASQDFEQQKRELE